MPSGDPLEDAFRAKLQAVITAASIPWPLKDTENTGTTAKPSESWIDIAFGTPQEGRMSWGAPGSDFWKETGEVEVGVFTKRNTGHEDLGTYALALRNAFRGAQFGMTTGQTIRITEVTPMQGGKLDGWWMRSVVLKYKVVNIG